MNKNFFIKNRRKVVEGLRKNSVLILFSGKAPFVSSHEKYDFRPNKNFFYLTGLDRQNFILILSNLDSCINEVLFIEEVDSIREAWEGNMVNQNDARSISGIQNILHINMFEEAVEKLFNDSVDCNLYLNLEEKDFNQPVNQTQFFAKPIKEFYPSIKISDVYPLLCDLRVIKSSEEILNIKKAIELTNYGIKSLMKNAIPGMMEYELEAYHDFTLRSRGVKHGCYKTIAAAGRNATILHYQDNNSKIKDGDLILFDLDVEYSHYHADISRTFPINGKFTERQKVIYNTVLNTQLKTIEFIKPGISFEDLNNFTKKILIEECKNIGLINEDNEIKRYYFHGVSHYLGMDTHDVGSYDIHLQPGMVITVEPGLYIKEEKLGIRIEDNILITDNGCEVLSKNIIKTIDEIESFMNK